MHDIHISIISHNQGGLVKQLLTDLSALDCAARFQVSLTINHTEDEMIDSDLYSFPIKKIHNLEPRGFGENHNNAFNKPLFLYARRYFLVLNPDINIKEDVISKLINFLAKNKKIGVIAPTVVNIDGSIEDSARQLPTVLRLFKKIFGRQGKWPYQGDDVFEPDWIAGMFMLFRSDVFGEIGGFDSKYFLYYEDVDICSRLWLSGYSVLVVQGISVIHHARRYSRKNLKYMSWHISSMMRFIRSDVYKRVKILHLQREPLR